MSSCPECLALFPDAFAAGWRVHEPDRPHRRQRRQPRPPVPPQPVGRPHPDPPRRPRITAPRRFGGKLTALTVTVPGTSEQTIVASKGRSDQAITPKQHPKHGLAHRAPVSLDEFPALSLDVWPFPPAS